MTAKNPEDQPAFEKCEDALAMCESLGTSLIGVGSRLSLGMEVKATIEIVKWDLRALNERVDDLTNKILEEQSNE